MNELKEDWQSLNLKAIQQRLEWVHKQPEGTIFSQPSGSHIIAVNKVQSLLLLLIADSKTLTTKLVQSILDLNDPLNFVLPYPQAIILALVWKRRPKKIYTIGFGGGTIPCFFHHYFADAIVECSDIDPMIVEVSQKFFGVQLDDRLKVSLQDGREYLTQQNPNIQYDIAIVDASLGSGYMPYHLVTLEFYQLCKRHLSEGGVLVANLFHKQIFNAVVLKTIQSEFSQIYLCTQPIGNIIAFATNGPPLNKNEIFARAEQIQDFHDFSFYLIEKALQLQNITEWQQPIQNLEQLPVLHDADPPVSYFDQ